MKIRTGIEPKINGPIQVPGQTHVTLANTAVNLKVPMLTDMSAQKVWIIEFGDEGPRIVAFDQPEVQQFRAKTTFTAESGPEFKAQEIARLIEFYGGPDDTRIVEDRQSFLGPDIIEVSISFWEVTL